MNLNSKSVLAKTLESNRVKLKFKDSSPFKDFVRNGDVVDLVRGVELDLSVSELFKIVYAGVQKNYTSFKAIQSALNTYISRMKAVASELNVKTDETRVVFISLPTILEKLYESKGNLGYELKAEFSNTEVMGNLIKEKLEDSEYISLLEGLTFDSDVNVVDIVKGTCKEFLETVPTSNPDYISNLRSLFRETTEVAMMRMTILLHLLNKLIEQPEESILADGITGTYFHNDIIPVLKEFRSFIANNCVVYVDAYKNMVNRKLLVFGFSTQGKPETMYVFKDIYNEYIQLASEIEGASDAVYGILFKKEFAQANIERIKNSISLLAEEFRVNMELDKKTGRRTQNIKLADFFTDYYIEMLEEYVGGNDKIACQIEEKFLEDIAVLPTREEVVKFAYDKLTKVVEVDDTNIALICLDIVELALNKLQPYLGTYVRALSKETFESKVLSNGSLVLASLMEVTADMLFDQLEITKG